MKINKEEKILLVSAVSFAFLTIIFFGLLVAGIGYFARQGYDLEIIAFALIFIGCTFNYLLTLHFIGKLDYMLESSKRRRSR